MKFRKYLKKASNRYTNTSHNKKTFGHRKHILLSQRFDFFFADDNAASKEKGIHYSKIGESLLVHHNLIDEDEGVVAVLGYVVTDGFVLYVAGFGGDGSA